MKNKLLTLLLSFCFFSFQLYAQQKISGKVTDESGLPLPGVSVVENGTTNGVATDFDGIYAITVASTNSKIQFSYVGMESQTISVNGRSQIDIIMKSDQIGLDEVVLIGYGEMKKSDLTGAVAKIKTEDVEQRIVSSPEQLLQGATPGVQVTTMGGAPGSDVSVTVRGGNSLNSSNRPLYVVDGFEMNSASSFYSGGSQDAPAPSPLSMINPNDIESISVLKDASATAIYGARGANGVIIITTKKGKVGKATIQLNMSSSFSALTKKIDVLDSKQWAQLYDEAAINSGNDPIYGTLGDPSTYNIYDKNINWQDEMYRFALGQDISLSVRGGKEGIKYSFSGNYNDAEGTVIKSDQRRISLRSNVEAKANDFLNIGLDSYFSNTMSNIVPYSNRGTNGFYSPIMQAVQFKAFDNDWLDEYNNISLDDIILDGEQAEFNPIIQIEDTTDELRTNFAQANLYATIELTKWLKFKTNFGFNYSNGLRNTFWGNLTSRGQSRGPEDPGVAIARTEISNFDYVNENTLSFDKTFNDVHKLSGVIGGSAHKWIRKYFRTDASGFEISALGYESFVGADTNEVPVSSHTEWGLASAFGRINYAFDDRYLLTFTGRYDGSSRFAKGNKWAFFPSAAFAWKINNEQFMQNAANISELKLRLSYGASGNQAIDVLSTVPRLNSGARYPINSSFIPGVSSSTYIYNNNLKWETTYQANIGVDLGLFNNRLYLTADVYQKNTEDLLLDKVFPISSGFSETTVNAGEIENKGWEFSINGDIIKNENAKWNVGISLSQNRSKVKGLDGEESMIGTEISGLAGSPNISYLGRTVGLFYGYKTNGIYQTEADVIDAPTKDGSAPVPGTFVYVDQATETVAADGTVTYAQDGVINEQDKVVIGNPEPDLIYGITSSFDYKGFSIGFVINGMLGNDVMNLNNAVWEGMNIWEGRYNQTTNAYNNRWVEGSTNATYPKPTLQRIDQEYLDRYIEDGSFLRLQNISIAYTWRPKNIKGIQFIKPYISASNLFVISSYSGYDPEIRGLSSALSPGVDLGSYPLPRTIKLGLNITLK
ncbi:MAG: SusC/RagA family TonB-linked outer membrane protein [Aestuariibaculum sp.]